MNKQEIFDTVATHLFTQGERAYENEFCQYKTDSGLKCAVGCLIPDDMYSSEIEDKAVAVLIGEDYNVPDYFSSNITLLSDLQNAHDIPFHWKATSKMKEHLTTVAAMYDLDTSVLNNLSFKDR